MGIGTFSGTVTDFDATLADGRLTGAARIASLETKDENLQAHLLSPDFFDAERHPEVSFTPSTSAVDGARVEFEGEVTIKGVTQPGHADGHDHRPGDRPVRQRALRPLARDDDRPHRVRDHLEHRHAERHEGTRRRGHPQGRPLAGEGGVDDARPRHLRQPPPRLAQHHACCGPRGAAARPGDELELWDGLREVPPYDAGRRRRAGAGRGRSAPHGGRGADAVLIATPEYNSSVPGALKNALDWASRPLATNVFRNKPVAVIGSSTGVFGAVWAQAELRKVLAAMGARVAEVELAVGRAPEKFDADGRLLDDDVRQGLRDALTTLVAETTPTSPPRSGTPWSSGSTPSPSCEAALEAPVLTRTAHPRSDGGDRARRSGRPRCLRGW